MRSRNIKPAFFINEELADLSYQARLLFIGLWCYADRDGLFEWREKRIKAAIYPYDNCDITKLLMSLHSATFIYKYLHDGKYYGKINNFDIHQNPHPHEAKSKIEKPQQNQCHDMSVTLQGMSGECTADVIIPDLRIDDTRIQCATEKISFGSHVKMTQVQFDGIVFLLNGDHEKYIELVNDYCAAKGKSYKDYSAAVRNFWRRDKDKKTSSKPTTFEQQKMDNTKDAMIGFVKGGDDEDFGQDSIRQIDW